MKTFTSLSIKHNSTSILLILAFFSTFLICFDLGQDNLIVQELIDFGYNSSDIIIKQEAQKLYSEVYSIEKTEETKKILKNLENKENIYLSLIVVSIISYLTLTA